MPQKYNHREYTKRKQEETPLHDIPTLAKVSCAMKSDKTKKRRAYYFGAITIGDKVIRQAEYLLVSNENIHGKNTRMFSQVPRNDR